MNLVTEIPREYLWLIILSFVVGYSLIALEFQSQINKAASAILAGILCWGLVFAGSSEISSVLLKDLNYFVGEISQILFFLLGAMAIVEVINVHRGFRLITDYINVDSKRSFLWIISIIAFFLSSVIDNLTATLVIVSLVKKIIPSRNDRLIIGGAVVIAANAGGAWTPIGDITTTMLWIGEQISTLPTMKTLFIPSLGNLIVALIPLTFCLQGKLEQVQLDEKETKLEPLAKPVLIIGIGSLLFVPVFKNITGLPPFFGILFGLSVLWVFTDILHYRYAERKHLRVPEVLTKIDIASVLFFLGILLAVDALDQAKILHSMAAWLDQSIHSSNLIAIIIGLISPIVDNIPLVAASMGMYEDRFGLDSPFWQLLAYCAGTGGSILIIGSAAGIVFMSLEKVNFFWFVKKISFPAFLGYWAGIFIYFLQVYLFKVG